MCVENYERLEADKKKQVQKKRKFEGPTIRYHSVLMMSEPPLKDENVDVEGYTHTYTHTHILAQSYSCVILFVSSLALYL